MLQPVIFQTVANVVDKMSANACELKANGNFVTNIKQSKRYFFSVVKQIAHYKRF